MCPTSRLRWPVGDQAAVQERSWQRVGGGGGAIVSFCRVRVTSQNAPANVTRKSGVSTTMPRLAPRMRSTPIPGTSKPIRNSAHISFINIHQVPGRLVESCPFLVNILERTLSLYPTLSNGTMAKISIEPSASDPFYVESAFTTGRTSFDTRIVSWEMVCSTVRISLPLLSAFSTPWFLAY
jgi:hypothetical protein